MTGTNVYYMDHQSVIRTQPFHFKCLKRTNPIGLNSCTVTFFIVINLLLYEHFELPYLPTTRISVSALNLDLVISILHANQYIYIYIYICTRDFVHGKPANLVLTCSARTHHGHVGEMVTAVIFFRCRTAKRTAAVSAIDADFNHTAVLRVHSFRFDSCLFIDFEVISMGFFLQLSTQRNSMIFIYFLYLVAQFYAVLSILSRMWIHRFAVRPFVDLYVRLWNHPLILFIWA